jgi:GNAT superfamily N-acetyltransferase
VSAGGRRNGDGYFPPDSVIRRVAGTPLVHVLGVAHHAHSRIRGTTTERLSPFPAGTAYAADDPELLCWVTTSLIEVTSKLYGRYVRRLSFGEQERYCANICEFARILGVTIQEPHYYIRCVGVATRFQGQCLGTALLRPTLDRCDREGLPACIEASTERGGRCTTGSVRPPRRAAGPGRTAVLADATATCSGLARAH